MSALVSAIENGDRYWLVRLTDGGTCTHEHPSRRTAEACLSIGRRGGRPGFGEGATVERGMWVPLEEREPWRPSPWVQLAVLGALAVLIILCGGAW